MTPLPQRRHRPRQKNACNTANLKYYTYVVVGGGIAGTETAKCLVALAPSTNDTVALVTPFAFLSDTTNVQSVTPHLEMFDVVHRPILDFVAQVGTQCTVLMDHVVAVRKTEKQVVLRSGQILAYGKLCLATGASPKLLAVHPLVLGVRDATTCSAFEKMLQQRTCVAVA